MVFYSLIETMWLTSKGPDLKWRVAHHRSQCGARNNLGSITKPISSRGGAVRVQDGFLFNYMFRRREIPASILFLHHFAPKPIPSQLTV
ncbi:unnamed protein product [Caenorhabditis brenneri]